MYQLSVLLHLLAAIVWVGGMLFLTVVVVPATRPLPPAQRGPLISAVGRQFRPVAWLAIAVLVVTGVYSSSVRGITWEMLADGRLLANDWGRLLALKIGIVTAMVVLSLLHDAVFGPASARALARSDAGAVPRLRRVSAWLARLSLLLALLVVALGVALVRGLPW